MNPPFDTVSVHNTDEASSPGNAGLSDWNQERKQTLSSPKLSRIASIMKMINDHIAFGPDKRLDISTSNVDRHQ
jgi:hypothetical protein